MPVKGVESPGAKTRCGKITRFQNHPESNHTILEERVSGSKT